MVPVYKGVESGWVVSEPLECCEIFAVGGPIC